jgi:HSP20 family protein
MSLIKREHRTTWPLETTWGQDVVDTAFGDMLRSFFGGESLFDRAVAGDAHLMRLEEYVEDDTIVVRAELPGIDPAKDVDISVSNGVLSLRAEREERSEEKRPDGYRSEFRYGRLARDIRLPEGIDESQITASYQDGVLEVRVPAPKPAATETPTKIEVARGEPG